MKISVMVPFLPHDTESVVPFAELVAHGSGHALWQGQSVTIDAPATFSALAGRGLAVPVGVGVALMPLQHPYLAALQARAIAATTGHGVVAGFGPAAPAFQAGVLGAPYGSQLGAIREYIGIVRSLLETGASSTSGNYFSCNAMLAPMDVAAPVEIGLGVLRMRMAELAGEIADVAITWITPASYIESVLRPALESGGRSPRIVAMMPAALDMCGRSARDLVLAGNRGHLQAPHYQEMLRTAGAAIDPDNVVRSAHEMLKVGGFLYGDEDVLTQAIRRYEAVGVDELVLNCTGVANTYGHEAAAAEVAVLLDIATNALTKESTKGLMAQ